MRGNFEIAGASRFGVGGAGVLIRFLCYLVLELIVCDLIKVSIEKGGILR